MSFLGGGAECSTAGNPLNQFMKHTQDDKSLQRDRLVGRGPGGLQEGMRGAGMRMGGDGDYMMDEFMQKQNPQLISQPSSASPLAMEQMRREFEQMHTGPQQRQNGSIPHWAGEFDPGIAEQKHGGTGGGAFNTADFERFVQAKQAGISLTPASANQASGHQFPMNMGYGGMYSGMGNMGMMYRPYAGVSSPAPQAMEQQNGKGKGRLVELDEKDWEAQFAQLESDATAQHTEDLDEQANRDINAELEEVDRSVLSETDHFGDFESIWRGIQAETAANGGSASANFADTASRSMFPQLYENDPQRFKDALGDDFKHMGESFADFENFDYNDLGINTHLKHAQDPVLGDYMFEDQNFFDNITNPFEEGVRIMDEGGNLSLAALAFEAAVRKDPNHVEAWTRLGAAQAQNEKETPAIRALKQALTLDPSNLDALMGLAVSYTNEGYEGTAHRTLERWVATKYPDVVADTRGPSSLDDSNGLYTPTDRSQTLERVTELFIQAAQKSPTPETMDPDVQVGLGVLFYSHDEFSKAVDCFSAALGTAELGSTNSPKANQLPLLWNRLGATLANGGRSEEAIDAYERALELNPGFVRARYNLGVSCINIGCYHEAAQHLLGALAMHEVVDKEGKEMAQRLVGGDPPGGNEHLDSILRQNQSTNLYDTLRRVFNQMGRKDLSDKVVNGVNTGVFRGEFEF